MKIPVAIKILNEATGPKANVEFMDVSICTSVSLLLCGIVAFGGKTLRESHLGRGDSKSSRARHVLSETLLKKKQRPFMRWAFIGIWER